MKSLLRTLTMLIALVASGLALVTVAPAPPAAADVRLFAQGSLAVDGGTSYCWWSNSGLQVEASWVRRFDLGKLNITGPFTPQLVKFGVGWAVPAPEQPIVIVRVRVYSYPADAATVTREELGRSDFVETRVAVSPSDIGHVLDAKAVSGFQSLDPDTEDAVVEVYFKPQVGGQRFTLGTSSGPETTPGFVRQDGCGWQEYADHKPNENIVIAMVGDDNKEYDRDGDGVTDIPDRDRCPDHVGPADGDYAGCPVLRQLVTASYDPLNDEISGNVSIKEPEASHEDSCRDQVEVRFFDAATSRLLGTALTKGASRAYLWRSWGIAEGTRVLAFADGFFDRDEVSGEGIAQCGSTEPSYVTVTGRDGDVDGLPDARDPCPVYWGDPGGGGCPLVERDFASLTYADGFLRGRLVVTDWGRVPEGAACQGANDVLVDVGTGPAQRTVSGSAAATSGAFAMRLDLTDGEQYSIRANEAPDRELAWCGSGATGAFTALVDRDDDLLRDNLDACDDVAGPTSSHAPGCPDLLRRVTASYDAAGVVSGRVTFTDAGAQPSWCSAPDQRRVEVWSQPGTGQPTLLGEGVYSLTDGRYSIALDDTLAAGAKYRVYVLDAVDPSAGWCGPASSGLRSEADDTDGDGVRDALDACDDVDGVPGGLAMGCPDLLRRVTASYAAGVVSGTVRFTGVQVPSTACAGEPRRVELWVRPPGTGSEPVLLKHGTYEPVDGTYSIGGDLPVGATYRVHVRGGLDPEAGYCVGVDSGNRTVGEADTDGDEVADDVDECDAVSGPTDDPDFPGCPTLERDVSGSYEDGLVSGAVTSGSPGCLGTVELQAVETAPDGTQSPAVSLSTGMDGTYVWEPTLGPGSQVQVVAPRVLASDRRGVCARAVTGLVEVPGDADTDGDSVSDDVDACDGVPGPVDQPQFPGCPALARSVTASYADGTVTGQVSVLGPNPAPAGTCLPTEVRAFHVRDGVPVRVGPTTTTSSTGAYSIALGGHLAAGSTYFVTTDRYLHGDAAVCGAAESATSQVPTAIGPPGGTVPGTVPGAGQGPGQLAPVLSGVKLTKKVIHAVGSRLKPRATKVRLSLNVAATVLVKVKGTTKAAGEMPGKKVLAKMTATLGPGGSSIRLTGKLGNKRLPPGVYRVSLRATNNLGMTTATAGKLKISP